MPKRWAYDESICYELALAGLVHDIGKLKLSRYLYGRNEDDDHKNDDGTEYMRMHSKLSYDILKQYDFRILFLILFCIIMRTMTEPVILKTEKAKIYRLVRE